MSQSYLLHSEQYCVSFVDLADPPAIVGSVDQVQGGANFLRKPSNLYVEIRLDQLPPQVTRVIKGNVSPLQWNEELTL
jgi:hypothetical protein